MSNMAYNTEKLIHVMQWLNSNKENSECGIQELVPSCTSKLVINGMFILFFSFFLQRFNLYIFADEPDVLQVGIGPPTGDAKNVIVSNNCENEQLLS